MVLVAALLVYVCLPALVAALLFRGGLVLLIAGVTYVRKDGQRASRLRLLWRAMVAWSPLVPVFALSILAIAKHLTWQPWLGLALLGLLAAVSVALPRARPARPPRRHLAGAALNVDSMKNTLTLFLAVTTITLGVVCVVQSRKSAGQQTQLASLQGELEANHSSSRRCRPPRNAPTSSAMN